MTPKIFVKYLLIALSLFVGYHFLIWHLYTSEIFNPKEKTSIGDLGRMSYQSALLHNRELRYTLPKEHLHKENYKDQKIDILTIGDSFSTGSGLGENPYYQDFLATDLNATVLNLAPYKKYNSLETLIGLYNSGYLKQQKPKIVIVQSVQRNIPDRFAKDIDFTIKDVEALIQKKLKKPQNIAIDFINTANYKLPYYSLKYHFNNNAQKNVYKFSLNRELFTKDNGQKILIYCDDIANISKFTSNNIAKVNKNLNKVANLLKRLNIELYFMPAPDKYDLYYDFLKDNKNSRNPFFELIRPMKKEYVLIDTKQILMPLLKNGIKDLYFIDDTHWSYKASKDISKKILEISK